MSKTFVIYYLSYLAFIILFAFVFSSNPNSQTLISDLKTTISSYGVFSPIVYIFLVCLAILIPPLPDTPFILVGGLTLAFPVAVISALIAFTISASVNFYVGRYFSEKIMKLVTTKNDRLQINSFSKYINTRSVFIFRILPGISFGLVSYAAGFAELSYKKYLTATMIPTFLYVVLIFYFIDEITSNQAVFPIFSLFSILVLIILPLLLRIERFNNWIKMTE